MDTAEKFPSVMVTGITGWLGRRLLNHLLRLREDPESKYFRSRIRGLVPPTEDGDWMRGLGVEVVQGDLLDRSVCERLTLGGERGLVLHLASVIHPQNVKAFGAVNVNGTCNLLSASIHARAERILMVSSSSVYGSVGKDSEMLTEESNIRPEGAYGMSKATSESVLRRVIGLVGVPSITIIRAPWFYGPGQPARQTRFFKMVQNGRFPLVEGGLNKRSLVYVDSLACGISLAATSAIAADQTYLMADERPYEVREIITTLRELMKYEFGFKVRSPMLSVPSGLLKVASAANSTIQRLGGYSQNLQVASELGISLPFDVKKAKHDLGYLPNQDLREGMRQSLLWCIEHGKLGAKS